MDFENTKRTFKQDNQKYKSDLAKLHTDIEQQKGQRDFGFPQAKIRQTGGKTKAVQKTKGKRYYPGVPYGKTGAASPGANNFRAKK